jgi:hypothetical protein
MEERTKIELTQIDKENWRFILYEDKDGNWFGRFSYSPKSAIDLSMIISLTDEEQKKAKSDRNYLVSLSDTIRNKYIDFLRRAIDTDKFIINNPD